MESLNSNAGRVGRHLSVLSALALALVASTQACGGGDSKTGLDGSGGSTGTGGNGGAPSGAQGTTGLVDLSSSETSSSSNGSGGAGGDDCGGVSVDAEPLQANLLLVIDRSESMENSADGFDDSKWATMVSSLENALASVPETMSVGLQFFPDASVDDVTGCGIPGGSEVAVPITAGAEGITAVTDALNDSDNAPAGNTPAADALALAIEYFTEGDGANLEGDKYVLLAIDGGPNCNAELSCSVASCTGNIDRDVDMPDFCDDSVNPDATLSCLDDDRTVNQVIALADAGITTLVVGIPGSDLAPYVAVLDQLADEGGAPADSSSPMYYQVSDADELADTLERLTSNLVTNCELVLDEPPPDVDEVNVFVDGEVVYKTEDGWAFDDPQQPTKIILQGEACALVETEGVQNLTVEYGCPTFDVPK